MSSEFEVIDHYFKGLDNYLPAGDLGIGDDGAVLSIMQGSEYQLVVVTDTLVQGIHFPVDASAYDIGWKSLAVNLSDLAAMGATPWCYSLAISVPKSMASDSWFAEFVKGQDDLINSLGIELSLIGGDTTSTHEGALSITVSAKGRVRNGKAVLRSGAAVDDLIVVTGNLGEGALGLKVAFDDDRVASLTSWQKSCALEALNRPVPQSLWGAELSRFATAAIDISDGFLQDLQHILRQSAQGNHCVSNHNQSVVNANQNVSFGAKIFVDNLPFSEGVKRYIVEEGVMNFALTGGDDYQLCFTLSQKDWPSTKALAEVLKVPITKVGKVTGLPKLEFISKNSASAVSQTEIDLHARQEKSHCGFQHF